MKIITPLLFILLTSSVYGKTIYVGSTPASNTVKTFLGIPLSDSVDFIRWKLVIGSNQYSIHCDYGIGKPNTNGFIDPKKIDLPGRLTKEGNYYCLYNSNKTILLSAFNAHVLHFANADKSSMTGTGGWSYTLYSSGTNLPLDIKAKKIVLEDSILFQGRTLCSELISLGLHVSENCYKLKWSIVLYTLKGKPATYKTRGTAYRNAEPKMGKWKIENGMIQLDGGESRLYFIMPDENILLFTDAKGKLLQGNEDFGYTLNRK